MNIKSAYPSPHMKASDLDNEEFNLTISHVRIETLGHGADQDTKPVLYFSDSPFGFQNGTKGLVLNVTNSNTLSDEMGDETDNWIGETITVYASNVSFAGKTVAGLRVKFPQAPAKVTPPVGPAHSGPPF
jgi:hypothetical protein